MNDPNSKDYCLSIVIPMYNEEQGAGECVRRVDRVLQEIGCRYEMIFVNDGSSDRTLEILLAEKENNEHVRVVDLSRNFGHQLAITAGIDHTVGDAVIIIDGDLQDPPEVFPRLIEKWQEGAHIVHARRSVRHGETAVTNWRAKLFYRIMRKISTIDIPVDVGDFRLIDKLVVDELKNMREHRRYLRGLATWVGYNQVIIDYEREPRFAGTAKYNLKTLIGLALSGVAGFSVFPLQLGWYLGSFLLAVSVLYGLFIVLVPSQPFAWAPLLVAIIFIGGLQLLCIGIVGEYLYIVLDDTRNRPLYLVRKLY